ncbi:hypothetical protein [Serinibacter salmoneus]|uniref:Subtilisin inhibitor-like n=1 Tax=Serinibacter salmoneus TaxID=556530 RepID=A0A2A9CZV5_9MICO|nr:hypothetical protein [Serinibacter salmoneus]PFG19967.1 hypothetical protein ATL40_1547 [Serinibacter salmoneus]
MTWTRSLAPALLALPLLTACSGADSDGDADSTDSATSSDIATADPAECSGVALVVDTGDMPDTGVAGTWCIEADAAIAATEVLAQAGVETEGTQEFGDAVVCRVNGVPAEDTTLLADDGSEIVETCEGMPSADAYWSLWLQTDGAWEYAPEGVDTLQVEPGSALGLLFVLNGQPESL